MLSDGAARQQALDYAHSFIVQAPAGSGKTELLTQRFLNLLAHAERGPEEIVAITFTKKAAAEMRERIVKALQRGANPKPPEEPHALTTWRLAQSALRRDTVAGWDLLHNSHRLRITTIDSLCASLTQQLPILARFGAQPKVTEQPRGLYERAVRALLKDLDEPCAWQEALIQTLQHLDNRIDTLEALLINMLSSREQWLDVLPLMQKEALRVPLEQALLEVVEDSLTLIARKLPQGLINEISELMAFASAHLYAEEALVSQPLDADLISVHLSQPEVESLSTWLLLKELFQTAKGEWRQTLNKKQGFLPESGGLSTTEKEARKSYKARAMQLLSDLAAFDEFRLALSELSVLPKTTYNDAQWHMVSALLEILPVLVAHLQLVFAEDNTVDFNEVALAALKALGDEEAPTELALALDYVIRHLLVDEFQDTSQLQYRLLQALTRGWQAGDGRTLFLVGDPMQSIYRFRQADVSLFMQVKEYGLGEIKLGYIRLSANFRSTNNIIDWVNHTFKGVFPNTDDPLRGAVSYSASSAIKPASQASEVNWEFIFDEAESEEANRVVARVQSALHTYPDDNIAILVRSRTSLTRILPALQKMGVPYQAVDIESLSDRAVIQDLFSLTCALDHLADRLSWLAILRAPWSGLTLPDLKTIVDRSEGRTIWQTLQEALPLSESGLTILARIKPILAYSLSQRGRLPLRNWIEETWWALGGPQALSFNVDIKNAELYFSLLQDSEAAGRLASRWLFKQRLSQLKAQSQTGTQPKVQIMTIHKAKGLEFDSVIIPGMGRGTRAEEAALLLWQERVNQAGQHRLLLAPIKPMGGDADEIYTFLAYSQKEKMRFESQRLFYVAVTRAKKRLYLLANVKTDMESGECKKPAPGSLLAQVWEQVRELCISQKPEVNIGFKMQSTLEVSSIKRLPVHYQLPMPWAKLLRPKELDIESKENLPEPYVPETLFSRAVGTVVHRYLAELSQMPHEHWQAKQDNIAIQLKALGVDTPALDKAVQEVCHIIKVSLNDARGRWILKPHQDAESEYALFSDMGHGLQKWVIDRTFVDDKAVRWVIDYKSSQPNPGESLAHFLEREKETYLGQLNTYARLLAMKFKASKICCGLYFPAVENGWIEWEWSTFIEMAL